MIRYDEALPLLVQTVHGWPGLSAAVARIAVIRDLRGRLHLVCQPKSGQRFEDADALADALAKSLGSWFCGPVRSTGDPRASGALARQLIAQTGGRWPGAWPTTYREPITGATLTITRADEAEGADLGWVGLQRLVAKEAWLSDQSASAPWPPKPLAPLLASFFSYKGGVGRSTLVALIASRLARDGKHVVVIDLDLEAPGQSAIFGQAPEVGVVDYLLEHGLGGGADVDGIVLDVTDDRIGGGDATSGSVRLVPAGAVGWTLLEKLARLDYLGVGGHEKSPVAEALRALLVQLKRLDPQPDYILIDSRSGLHDLGGLSLHALAHIDVLVMRDDAQSRQGTAIALRALCQRTSPDELRLLLVEGMAALRSDAIREATEALRDDMHAVFTDTVYQMSDVGVPPPEDAQAPHYPYPMAHDSFLERREQALAISADVLERGWLRDIVDRLHALVGR